MMTRQKFLIRHCHLGYRPDQLETLILVQARFACLRFAAGGHFVSTRGSLRSPGVTLVNYKGNSISKYVFPTVILTIKTRLMYIYLFIYIYICNEFEKVKQHSYSSITQPL